MFSWRCSKDLNITLNKRHILILCMYCSSLYQHNFIEHKSAWRQCSTENSLYIRNKFLWIFFYCVHHDFQSHKISAHTKTIHLSRWPIPRTATTPSSSGCIIRKQRRPASPLAQEGQDELKDPDMTTVKIIHCNNASVCQSFAVCFPNKQFCLLITINYNFDKNCNFQRAVAKFVKLQQPAVRVTPVKAASQSFSLVPF